MSELIQEEVIAVGVTLLTLNRPERRNALSIELMQALCDRMEQLGRDAQQRVVVLTGAGPVFSAGLDLREAAQDDLVETSAGCVARTLQLIRETPLIVVAAVRGGAFAGGAGVLAACDIVIAEEGARIGFPEARRGLLPALISDVLRHKVREGDLRELFLVGDPIDATRAQQVGLVQRVVPAESLIKEAESVARSLLAGGPETIRQTKELLNQLYRPESTGSHSLESHLEARRSEEAREGMAAFAEKREPWWSQQESK